MSRSYKLNAEILEIGITAHHAAQVRKQIQKATTSYRKQRQKINNYRTERRELRALKRLQRRQIAFA